MTSNRRNFLKVMGLTFGSATLSSGTSTAEPAQNGMKITSRDLNVVVDPDFPRVIQYETRSSGAVLYGTENKLDTIAINDKQYTPQVESEISGDTAKYVLKIPEINISLHASLSVDESVMEFRVTDIKERGSTLVETFAIPQHSLVSVRSTQNGATLASTKFSVNADVNGDYVQTVDNASVDAEPAARPYALVNTNELAAGVETSAFGEDATEDPNRLAVQTDQRGSYKRTGIWSQPWLYRESDTDETTMLPWAKVVVTSDRNSDGTVDWQDGAIAFRDIMYNPPGVTKTKDRVAPYISFNFGSNASHPFLKALDSVKISSLITDGLGQFVLLKGYQSEGHDSAHPDFGGHYNFRAGGLNDLRMLIQEGAKYNAEFGVHLNTSESYPEAHAFDDELVNFDDQGWRWLDQSYEINHHYDLISSRMEQRLQQLRREVTTENFSFIYLDVYFGHGWNAYKTAKLMHERGWDTVTEFPQIWERYSIWSHWANDVDYGPDTSRGINSTIIRFLRFHQKDVFVSNTDLLPVPVMHGWQGWTGENNFNRFVKTVFSRNIPVKFLQHHQIQRWTDHEIDFTGNVRVTDTDGTRKVYQDGRIIQSGGAYLIPWNPDEPNPKKLYHWNPEGGKTTWELPGPPWSKKPMVKLYKLTDQGRVLVEDLPVTNGNVTINAEAETPYVIYHHSAPQNKPIKWGEGTPIKDPGFNDHDLSHWEVEGDTESVNVHDDDLGQTHLHIAPGDAVTVSQRLHGLDPGTYAASVWTQIGGPEGTGSRTTTLSVVNHGDKEVTNQVNDPLPVNYIQGNDKHGRRYQRMKVLFNVPRGNDTAILRFRVEKGDVPVEFDDVRFVPAERTPDHGHDYFEDFEHVDQGWGPFIAGPVGGIADQRIHLAEKNTPWTNSTINGDWSFKILGKRDGIEARTSPTVVEIKPNHTYRVGFQYKASGEGYRIVAGSDITGTFVEEPLSKSAEISSEARPWPDYETNSFETTVETGGCPRNYIGFATEGSGRGMLIVDDFYIDDLGPVEKPEPACVELEVDAGDRSLRPGYPNEITTQFTNNDSSTVESVTMSLNAPESWQVKATSATTFTSVAPSKTVTTTWQVTPPADAEYQEYTLTGTATYEVDGDQGTVTSKTTVETLPPPPTTDVYASDIPWVSASNGWGPVERDMSNGGRAAGDGHPITLNGVVYEKGLGVHAPSTVRYYLDSHGTTFTAKIGVDDEETYNSSVVFKVLTDGRTVYESPVMRPDTPTEDIEVDITGAQFVDLVVTDAGDGKGNDHADWAMAMFHCTEKRHESDSDIIPQQKLSIHDYDSADSATNGEATNAIDSNPSTIWHTAWSQVEPDVPYPHFIALDLGGEYEVDALSYLPRQEGSKNGMIEEYEIYVSLDGETWGEPVASGAFPDSRAEQQVDFEPIQAQYVKLVGLSSINGEPFAAVAELNVSVPS